MSRLFLFIALFHAYIGWRLVPDMPFGALGTSAMVVVLLASATLMPLAMPGRRLRREAWADRLAWAGLIAMGFFSSLLVLTVLRDVALLGMAVVRLVHPGGFVTAALERWSAAAVPPAAALLTALGLFNARRRAAVRAVDVPIAGLPASLHGFMIAQISDIHVGRTIKRGYVEAIVDAVNDLHPDMIAVTGDLVDGSVRQLGKDTEPLSRLRARHGAYFVTGNHEYYSGVASWVVELRRLGLHVLMNEHVVLDHDDAHVVVAGVTDYSAHRFDPAQRSDPEAAIAGAPQGAAVRVLLAHQPRSAYEAAPAGYHLQLSGHTHGGQFLPWNFFVRLQQPFTAGLHRLGAMWVYVSRGTGYWGPPKRLGAPSEITCLRLVRA